MAGFHYCQVDNPLFVVHFDHFPKRIRYIRSRFTHSLMFRIFYYGSSRARVILLNPKTLKKMGTLSIECSVGAPVCKAKIPAQDKPFVVGKLIFSLHNDQKLLNW